MQMLREVPYPSGCGCDNVMVTQEWSTAYNRWIDTGLRKIPDPKMTDDTRKFLWISPDGEEFEL